MQLRKSTPACNFYYTQVQCMSKMYLWRGKISVLHKCIGRSYQPQGALLTLTESSSREAGHELFPLVSPCSLPDCPLPVPWSLNQVLAPCSEGLPAGLTLFCDSPSSEGNFSDEPVENLTFQIRLSKKARKRLPLGLPDKCKLFPAARSDGLAPTVSVRLPTFKAQLQGGGHQGF